MSVAEDSTERMVHIIVADNLVPSQDSNDIHNNMVLASKVFDTGLLIEDLEDQFHVVLDEDEFAQFNTVGDIVRWVEAKLQ